ncbi:glycosyltransferase family 4 protein [Rudanella lutea]|uniref:glycosyltransferase family 4 protein n=1 Tax=Rudanella lutea TaxID=451374 RepID=UPI00036FC0A0|nr:glycosyltransferase family 4 protein [Rudanella lutea]
MNLLLIGHDANRAGAQLVLLQLMRLLRAQNVTMRLLLGEGGPLLADYQALAPVTIWPAEPAHVVGPVADKVLGKLGVWESRYRKQQATRQATLRQELNLDGVDLVLVNTVTSARWFGQLNLSPKVPVVTFVHELAMSVQMYTRPDELRYLLDRTTHMLAVSKATANYYMEAHGFDPARITLFTLIDTPRLVQNVDRAREADGAGLVRQLGIPPDAILVGGCGNAEWRKGNDLFVLLARLVANMAPAAPIYFVWVGVPKGPYRDELWLDVQKAWLTERVHFLEPTPDVLMYMSRFNMFALTSREDPYPLVVLEAGLCEVPVICFAGAGGSPELVETDAGVIVPYLHVDAMARAIVTLAEAPEQARQLGQRLREKVLERHPAEQGVSVLLNLFTKLLNP